MIAARTSELPACPECRSDHYTAIARRGHYVRLACDSCGQEFTVEADDA